MTMQTNFRKQSGAALIVGLLLLVVITVLAISGMSTATTELAMARNDQNYENAFQAAETGLEAALAQGQFNSLGAVTVTQYINSYDKVTANIQPDGDPTIVPDRAFSLGVGSGIVAYHFLTTATAVSERSPGTPTDRDSNAVHTQAFYVVGPQGPTL
ncbi:MAG: pilus assembly PilX N-terminal domain-containing protein [Gammaproteobacteria bacterium]|jgi:type IV pilus assembly protein PilX|nr:pilus assembly PilX N-terminal domain-containing protein [Gammaproteobacteria bacterium]